MPPDNIESDPSASASHGAGPGSGTEPLACVSCRARKLKCDRIKPSCSRCVKVSNECVYPESRRKPTFKRRNVKELEARLAQVEDYLNQVNKAVDDKKSGNTSPDAQSIPPEVDQTSQNEYSQPGQSAESIPDTQIPVPCAIDDIVPPQDPTGSFFDDAQLMGLGMSESLPPMPVMEELNNIYFQTQHYFIPIIHPGRYLQAFYGSPLMKPPLCLQYSIWALAAVGHVKYDKYHEIFYRRARQYIDADEMKGQGEYFITVNHAQAWGLTASYEAKRMLFTRSTMSAARCVRLCQMMGLDRIDGDHIGSPPTLGPPLTWAELEERRRVFWGAFCIDAHSSISTGWPSLINLDDIVTRLPSPEDDFLADNKVETAFMHEVWQGASYTGFAGTVVVCQIFKTILHHVYTAKPDDRPEDIMHGGYWKRHRQLDNDLSSIFMFLPEKMRLPQNVRDPVAAHTNLNLHASVICLHHAAVEKVEKHDLPKSLKDTSIIRLKAAAEEVSNIIKLSSSSMPIFKSPLCALSMYCATTVYVYLAKQDPLNGLTAIDLSNLEVIINAMESIARHHNITRAFLQQAYLDIERNGLSSSIRMPGLRKYRNPFGGTKSNIPMICRSSVSKHTDVSPILPGRLPLGRAGRQGMVEFDFNDDDFGENVVGQNCFQAVLGAVTRNVAKGERLNVPIIDNSNANHKRKRVSPSPGPEMMTGVGRSMNAPQSFGKEDANIAPNPCMPAWAASQVLTGNVILPDRTASSSSSSPAQHYSGSRTTTSSHTSPSLGLGNTVEENRIDLRAFQGRISTPLWQSTEETTFFAQINESMINVLSTDTETWGILDADINWDNIEPGTVIFFSNPISDFLFPDQVRRPQLAPRPKLNESLLAIDGPNATVPTCPTDAYRARILSRDPLVIYLEGFLSGEERRSLLDISEPIFTPSTVTHDGNSTHRDTSVRDSEVALIPRDDTVRCIERRARALQGWPADLFIERLRTQRYRPGGHYGYHFDWTANHAGWGRVSSIMAWVDGQDVKGGGTRFPLLRKPEGEGMAEWCKFIKCLEKRQEEEKDEDQGVTFNVIPGNAVYWENFGPDGRGYEETWHAGLAVDEGIKVGLNIWSFGRIR
ncbi:hypothetical protein BGZ63DRAFT_360107 [Mariannaea sp. PMI_226]|nr:hypothetical protein BGZ63DRAFT_360107 [Mariannaea sp. PMI_226]